MKLYDLELSGNSYRVRLLLSLLGLKHEAVTVNLMKAENREPWFLKLNPRGQVPTLDDAGTVVWDSMAILVYLARKYGGEKWRPIQPQGMADVMQWLALMENETLYGLAKARVICKFKRPGNLEEAQLLGCKGLDVLEQPPGHLLRQYVERVADGLPDSLHAIVGADGGQHVRRVGPLAPAGMQPAPRTADREQGVEQLLLCRARQQASAELAQHAGVKTGIVEW